MLHANGQIDYVECDRPQETEETQTSSPEGKFHLRKLASFWNGVTQHSQNIQLGTLEPT